MSMVAQTLREARLGAGLSLEAMAKLVELPVETVDAFEQGAEFPSAPTLREYATLFGSRVERFLAHGAATSPAALLFRSAAEHGTDLSKELQASDLRLLGKFLASVADVAELERLLGLPPPDSVDVEAPDRVSPAWEHGRICAERVRSALGLGNDAIPSMVSLLEDRLRWSTFFVTPDELSIAVQGASTATPKPGILVNLVGGRESWWRTRASLAHEMYHILFDARAQAQPYLLSPDGDLEARGHWALVEHFQTLEQRANAFAAYFLVPGPSLRSAVASSSPDAEEAIESACMTFGVSRTMAVRRLGHEFNLSAATQTQMLRRSSRASHPLEHPDAAISPGLRSGRLGRLVRKAVENGQIDAIQARSILELPMSVPIPALGDRGRPLIHPERLACARAEAYAWTLDLGPCRTIDVTKKPDGWVVVVESYDRDVKTQTTIALSPKFEPIPASW